MRATHVKSGWALVAVLVFLLAFALPSMADGPEYTIEWWTVDGGGTTVGAGSPSPYSLGGTVGQPDAGHTLSNGGYVLTGGFWVGAESELGANSIYLPLVLRN
jgi:hypothetical protein